jgi:hypothetical protein
LLIEQKRMRKLCYRPVAAIGFLAPLQVLVGDSFAFDLTVTSGAYRIVKTAGRGSIVKRLTVAVLVLDLFTPTVFAQTAEQKESPSCIEIIRGTQRQCENIITPTAEQLGERSLPGNKGGKGQARPLMPEQRKASATKVSKAAAKARAVYFLEMLPGSQIRDFEDSPEGPIISVAR